MTITKITVRQVNSEDELTGQVLAADSSGEAERGRLLAVNAYLFLADAPTIGEKRAAYRNSLRDLPPSTNKAKDGEWSEKLEES